MIKHAILAVIGVAMGLAVCGSARAAASREALTPAAIQRRIIQHRTAQTTLTITGPDGKPLANAPVTIRQTRHRFLFGCNGFGINPTDATDLQRGYQRRFAELLNFATLPFYWGSYERTEGQPGEARLRAMAQWCAEHNIRTKGHPLCWQQVAPRWLEGKSMEEVERLQIGRITREVTAFRDEVRTWDVVNEAVAMPTYKGEQTPIPAWCAKIGQVELIRRTFAAARAANPQATLILNDYDTSEKYARLIQQCLDAKIPIDVIGIQSHMHGAYWGQAKAWEACERFAKFGKPLHFTETTIISAEPKRNQRWSGPNYTDWTTTPEGEARQAQQVAEFYTILFSHPAVEAITWWDFSDHGAWLGAPSGLIRADMTPKPAYEALIKLVKGQWWTAEVKATTDAAGRVTFRGFLGDYAVEIAGGKGAFRIEKAGEASAAAWIE